MSSHRVTLIPGDGIGPEVTEAAVSVVAATGVSIDWERVEAGAEVVSKYGTPVPETVMNSIRGTGVALKGPVGTPIGGGGKSINVTLRKTFGAFANLRHFQSLPGVDTVFSHAGVPVDIYVPGCPPGPQSLMHGILTLHDKIMAGEVNR